MFPLYDNNPTRHTPVMTYALITLCGVVFFYQVSLAPVQLQQFIQTWALIPRELFRDFDRELITLVSSQFLHGSLGHLLGNMWFLWLFGNNLEDILGRWPFLFFYLFCGGLAAWVYAVLVPASEIPLLGASGAIAGVMGGYIVRFPQAQIHTLFIVVIFVTMVRIPAVVYLGFWIFWETWRAATVSPGQPGIAYLAHVVGFLAGVILLPWLPERQD